MYCVNMVLNQIDVHFNNIGKELDMRADKSVKYSSNLIYDDSVIIKNSV